MIIKKPTQKIIIGAYGAPFHGIQLDKKTALKFAEMQVQQILNPNLFQSGTRYRIVSCELQDQPNNPRVGHVVATCVPVPACDCVDHEPLKCMAIRHNASTTMIACLETKCLCSCHLDKKGHPLSHEAWRVLHGLQMPSEAKPLELEEEIGEEIK